MHAIILTAAAMLAALTCPRPVTGSSFVWLAARALFCFLITVGTAGAAGRSWRLAAIASWFPALFYLLFTQSLFALPVAILITVFTTRHLIGLERHPEPERESAPVLFAWHESSYWTARLGASMFASACLVSAIPLAVAGWDISAATATVAGTVSASWHWVSYRNRPGIWRIPVAATVLLLALRPFGFGGGDGEGAANGEVKLPAPGSGGGHTEQSAEVHSGIILWPEEEPHTVLVAPLPAMRQNLFSKDQSGPLSIPFFGVYWLYRPPHKKPPPNSFSVRGDPARSSFRSTGVLPLSMEARQNFGRMISSDCCRSIRLAIRNGDRHPNTIRAEFLLLNTVARTAPLSLGQVEVKSTLRWQFYDERPPVSETLEFAVPRGSGNFDEAVVRFHLSAARWRLSPRIAIERFVFVPAP